MILAARSFDPAQAVVTRFSALAPLDDAAITALRSAVEWPRVIRARRELLAEGDRMPPAQMIVSGWAARVRTFADGRRQLSTILLPGDLIGMRDHPRALAATSIIAMTDVALCAAPPTGTSARLDQAYAISAALHEAYLLAQVARLGRLNAQERIGDFLLELLERLTAIGMAYDGDFAFPCTQEMLADALGLTPVHINRTLQAMRRDGDLNWTGGRMTLRDPAALARKVGRAAVRVSAPD